MENNNNNIPAEYRPISMWGYFGYQILFSIPIVGLILLIIYSFSSSNINRRNFARSYFCYTILILLVLLVIIAIALATGAVQSIAANF